MYIFCRGLSWRTRQGVQHANYFGSLTQASTVRLGRDASGKDVYIPFSKILPMVDPNTLVIGGWDISNLSLAAAMERAQVLEPDLQRQLAPVMESIVPWPSVYYPDFIASNQTDRANNTLSGESKKAHLEQIRGDIAYVIKPQLSCENNSVNPKAFQARKHARQCCRCLDGQHRAIC